MKNIYQIERGLNKVSAGWVNLIYSTGQVILPVLFGFLLGIKSLMSQLIFGLEEPAEKGGQDTLVYRCLSPLAFTLAVNLSIPTKIVVSQSHQGMYVKIPNHNPLIIKSNTIPTPLLSRLE